MQDGSFICVLQGMNKNGEWISLQNWQFSGCGNSYHDKLFPPKAASSFVTTIKKYGNFHTRLRFKLLGVDKIYYSNEFIGAIDLVTL